MKEVYLVECCKTGLYWFIWDDDRLGYSIIKNDTQVCINESHDTGMPVAEFKRRLKAGEGIIIDEFLNNEEFQLITNNTCLCDLFTVLMVTGCKCGGK